MERTSAPSEIGHSASRPSIAEIGAVLSLGVMALSGLVLSKATGKPLVAMTAAMRSLAAGDHAVAVPAQGQKDEIGQMAAAVQVFEDNAVEKMRLEAEATRARQIADEARAHEEEVQKAAAERQATVVDALAAGLERLAEGDLLSRIDQAFTRN